MHKKTYQAVLYLKEQVQQVLAVLNSQRKQEAVSLKPQLPVPLPLESLENFEKLEEHILDISNRNQFVSVCLLGINLVFLFIRFIVSISNLHSNNLLATFVPATYLFMIFMCRSPILPL